MSHNIQSSVKAGQSVQVSEECSVTVEACREFNASIPPTGHGLPKGATDKNVLGSVGALWRIM